MPLEKSLALESFSFHATLIPGRKPSRCKRVQHLKRFFWRSLKTSIFAKPNVKELFKALSSRYVVSEDEAEVTLILSRQPDVDRWLTMC